MAAGEHPRSLHSHMEAGPYTHSLWRKPRGSKYQLLGIGNPSHQILGDQKAERIAAAPTRKNLPSEGISTVISIHWRLRTHSHQEDEG